MDITNLFGGAYKIKTRYNKDARGYFANILCKKELKEIEFDEPYIDQINLSLTKKRGTLRGLHYQVSPNEQTKMILCQKGKVFDVIVDMRPKSPSYKEWKGMTLSEKEGELLVIPAGFAQGFLTLTPGVKILYLNNGYYNPECERGVRWDDPKLNITWPFDPIYISDKDSNWRNI
jgi:dTDP-4-dehydrorhamnose 3,5-epimerase